MAECNSCGAPIQWVVVAKSGKKMPIDLRPVRDGNIVKLASHDGETGLDLVEYDALLPGGAPRPKAGDQARFPSIAEAVDPVGRPRFKSHFATCPNADEHRR